MSTKLPGAEDDKVKKWLGDNCVTVHGESVPNPFFSFSELAAPESIHRAIQGRGYTRPTVIQSISWPIILQNRDVVGIAKTGSGKTMAFMVPALMHVLEQPPLRLGDGPIVLALAPTRELVSQIESESRIIMNRLQGVRMSSIYGGVSKHDQIRTLRAGIHVCVATPGRLIDILESNATNLLRVTFLVLDEADCMLDMGFEPQIRDICSKIRADRQTLMFSATWPESIRNLAVSFLKRFIRIHIGNDELQVNSDISQVFYVVSQSEKKSKLIQLLEDYPEKRILIFVGTKKSAEQIGKQLTQSQSRSMLVIHGDRDQADRDAALDRFRRESSACLIATDVAARGLDIKSLDIVVNFDFPSHVEDYVHRIGRTGRAGNKGHSFTFLTGDEPEKTLGDLFTLLSKSNYPISRAMMLLKQKISKTYTQTKNHVVKKDLTTFGAVQQNQNVVKEKKKEAEKRPRLESFDVNRRSVSPSAFD